MFGNTKQPSLTPSVGTCSSFFYPPKSSSRYPWKKLAFEARQVSVSVPPRGLLLLHLGWCQLHQMPSISGCFIIRQIKGLYFKGVLWRFGAVTAPYQRAKHYALIKSSTAGQKKSFWRLGNWFWYPRPLWNCTSMMESRQTNFKCTHLKQQKPGYPGCSILPKSPVQDSGIGDSSWLMTRLL